MATFPCGKSGGHAVYAQHATLVRTIRWRIRSAADVEMAQIAQRGAVFFAHTPREVGVSQMLIARKLRHVL